MTTDSFPQVVVVPDSVRVTGNAHGSIYFQIDETHFFPAKNWDDFIVRILGWWINNALDLLNGIRESPILYFMDGSVHVLIDDRNPELWVLNCVARYTDSEEIEHTVSVKTLDFLRQLASAAERLIKRCKELNWESPDLNELISTCEKAKHRLQV